MQTNATANGYSPLARPAYRSRVAPHAILEQTLANHSPTHQPQRSLRKLLGPIFRELQTSYSWRAESAGFWETAQGPYWMPKLVFRRAVEEPSFKIGVFAGLHGDEPAGVLAIADFIRALETSPARARGYEIHVYPLINPTGYEDGTRLSRSGADLNREFWRKSAEPEVQLIENEILSEQFHGYIALHSDDTSDGMYAFARGATLTQHLLKPALAAVEVALPVNRDEVIDGFHAVEGIITGAYGGILSAPPGAKPTPFEVILESPSEAPIHLQRGAFVLALVEILSHYRRMIAYGGEL